MGEGELESQASRDMFGKISKDRLAVAVLIGVLAVALGLRVLYMLNQAGMAIPVRSPDTFLYDMIPRHLLAGKGYIGENYLIVQKGKPTAFYGPVYPLFVAAIYRLFGYSFRYIQIAQILVSLLTCYVVFKVGELLYGKRAGLMAAALFAVYPELAAYPSAVLSETLFVFLEILFVYLLAKAISNEKPGMVIFGLAGATFALAFLCRQVISVAPIIMLPFAIRRYRNHGWAWMAKRASTFLVAALVIIVPWSVRNYIDMGTLSPAATTGGVTFWWGNKADRRGMDLPTALDQVKKENPGLSEIEMNSLLYKLGFKEIAGQGPAELASLIWSKWRKMWMPYLFNEGRWRPVGIAQYVVIYTLLISGLFGSFKLVKSSPGTAVVAIVLVAGVAVHLASIGNSRYSLPYLPLLMITSAPVWLAAVRWVKDKQLAQWAPERPG